MTSCRANTVQITTKVIMHVDLKVSTSGEYFSQVEREIDWEEDDSSKVPIKQADEIGKILATEVSIFLLRRSTGFCGSLIDHMRSVRNGLIKNYESEYDTYIKYNDFY
jgi:hypothetical protein